MPKTYHCHFSIRGGLHWSDEQWLENSPIFSGENGEPLTVYQSKEFLMDELKMGREVIPIGECSNFDYEHGCQGHENLDESEE